MGSSIENPNGAPVFLRLFNVTVGSVTIGTTTTDIVIPVAANTVLKMPLIPAIVLGTALTAAVTLNKIENDTTDPGTSRVKLTLLYV